MKLNRKIRDILDILRGCGAEKVHLFGSWARDEADETSDLDVVVIMPSQSPFLSRMQQIGRSLPLSMGAVDILAYTPEEWRTMLAEGNAFAEMVMEEGKVLYEKQPC